MIYTTDVRVADNGVKILQGDALCALKTLTSCSAHCCVTSPPYFGLRDYGVPGQLGLERSPAEYIQSMVSVFMEVYRVLRNDGTLWLNIGDSYAGSGKRYKEAGLKEKDLIGIPWRVAFALQKAGWYLRQDIIWSKPNPMPESVQDRCTKAHEYIFLLAKAPSYYWDATVMREPAVFPKMLYKSNRVSAAKKAAFFGNPPSNIGRCGTAVDGLRKKRSVWTVASRAYRGAHFATFPTALIEPCILAGCPKKGVVLDPFAGSGTTGLVAIKNNRDAVLCELNEEYVRLSETRIKESAHA